VSWKSGDLQCEFWKIALSEEILLLGCDAVCFLSVSMLVFLRMLQLLVTANVLPNPTMMMEGICFSEDSVLTRATRRYISEDRIPHGRRSENLNSDTATLSPSKERGEECRRLGCAAVWLLSELTFRRSVSHPSSG
jgi:hypothetical protein